MLDKTVVGEVLRFYRLKRGLTLDVVSGLAGMSRDHLNKLELGNKLANLNSIFRIAHALEVPPGEMIAEIDRRMKEKGLYPW